MKKLLVVGMTALLLVVGFKTSSVAYAQPATVPSPCVDQIDPDEAEGQNMNCDTDDKAVDNKDDKAGGNQDNKNVNNNDDKAGGNQDDKNVNNKDDKAVANQDDKSVNNNDDKAVGNQDDKDVNNNDDK